MKKILAFILTICMIFSLAACGGGDKKGEKTTADETKKLDYANMTADDLLKEIKDPQNVTLDEFINLVSTYSYVKITDDMELEDNITSEAIKKLKENKAKLPEAKDYIGQLLKSEAPQVRGYAVSSITSFLGVSDANKKAVKEMLKNEKEPYVICCAVKALANEGGKDKEIGQFLLDAAKNENSRVRRQAALALGSSWNKDLDGAVDAVIELMNDSDIEVRRYAYQYAGKLGDEKVIEPIVNMLKNEADAALHGSGVSGLVTLWYDFPFHENTSEAAYRATIDYLKTTPGNDKIPDWTAVNSFVNKNESHYDAWRAKATYFDPNEIAQVMTDIVKNTNLNSLVRSYAIREVAAHCSKEQFDALGTVVNSLDDKNASSIQQEYQTNADKLNKQ